MRRVRNMKLKLLENWKQESFEGNAIYKIVLKGSPIERLLEKDTDGILVIGKTKNLKNRLKQFNNALGKGKGHSEGNTLFLIKEQFDRKFKNPSLWYWYKEVRECDLDKEEAEEIKQYMNVFGEVPSLNSNIPQKKVWINKKQCKKCK